MRTTPSTALSWPTSPRRFGNAAPGSGRDYSEIEKTVQMRFNLGEHGERVEETIEHLHEVAVSGVQAHTGAYGRLITDGI
jgi:hypothetical protein